MAYTLKNESELLYRTLTPRQGHRWRTSQIDIHKGAGGGGMGPKTIIIIIILAVFIKSVNPSPHMAQRADPNQSGDPHTGHVSAPSDTIGPWGGAGA